jgi:hypothetical protein
MSSEGIERCEVRRRQYEGSGVELGSGGTFAALLRRAPVRGCMQDLHEGGDERKGEKEAGKGGRCFEPHGCAVREWEGEGPA